MPVNPLFSCRVKIDRAYKHFQDFQSAIDAYGERNPNSVVTDEETEPGIKIDTFRPQEGIPIEFSSYIGDIAHNLMSALDSLAMALAQKSASAPIPENVLSRIYFPIGWEAKRLDSGQVQRFFELIPPKAVQMIRSMQPYKGGHSDYLFKLWLLNIIDKHRTIVTVAADLIGIQYRFSAGPPFPPSITPARRFGPLKHGDELNRRGFHQPEFDAHAHFMLQVAFGEGQVFAGEPVIPTLDQMVKAVEGTIYAFAQDIFGQDGF